MSEKTFIFKGVKYTIGPIVDSGWAGPMRKIISENQKDFLKPRTNLKKEFIPDHLRNLNKRQLRARIIELEAKING